MLSFAGTEDRQSTSLIFTNSAISKSGSVSLISDSSSLLSSSSFSLNNSCEDYCSFYSGPSDATILAFGENSESCGSIAYDSASGSFGYSGSAESCGSIASSASSFSGSACSYSC